MLQLLDKEKVNKKACAKIRRQKSCDTRIAANSCPIYHMHQADFSKYDYNTNGDNSNSNYNDNNNHDSNNGNTENKNKDINNGNIHFCFLQ